ncbi:MAG: NAD(P)-dependent oxidoreductase [Chloroflexi bacterium]|nr:NAD(P)-dependent oxidoreductase [Chloroflexota bacterium]
MTLLAKSVLVTGATWFLGSALTRRLAGDGAHVRALARHPERDCCFRNIDGVEIIQGDITDENQMRDVIQGCKIVFHTAGVLNGSIEMQRQVNVGGTRNVMRAAAEAGVERVVHVSSAGAYGFGRRSDISEDMPLEPGHAAYGISKAEAEDVVRKVAREHGLDYSIIRPGMIYGPGSRVWTEGMFRIAGRKPTVFVGDGSGSIPAIYIDDVVDLMTVLAVHPAAARETFNCTPDPSPTGREFLGAYAALAGHDRWLAIPITPLRIAVWLVAVFAPSNTRLKDLPLLIEFVTSYRRFRMDKARELLGWQPQIGLSEGIKSCVPYLREKGLLALTRTLT